MTYEQAKSLKIGEGLMYGDKEAVFTGTARHLLCFSVMGMGKLLYVGPQDAAKLAALHLPEGQA